MSQVHRFKSAKSVRRIKLAPPYKVRRLARELDRDIDIALQYGLLIERVASHNVAVCAFAPRASPAVH